MIKNYLMDESSIVWDGVTIGKKRRSEVKIQEELLKVQIGGKAQAKSSFV